MATLVVFLRGVNVGGHKAFRPSALAQSLKKYGVVNVGAAGTFVVTKPVSQATLRAELRRCLPFETEIMICQGRDILDLASSEPFTDGPDGPEIVRFLSVLAKAPRVPPQLPLTLPTGAGENWLVRIVAVRGRFAFGIYRRALETIALLGKLDKLLGGSVTTRNWNTITKLVEAMGASRSRLGVR